jgi:hypothetical protein
MKFSLILIFLALSIGGANAAGADAFLLKAGWEKQSGGWMDPETAIVWGPETEKMSWGQAKAYCQSLNLGGRSDWRLPTVVELQRSVCKVTGYMTRTACPQPRNHQTDLWLLDNEKSNTYWASDLIPGDPYNAYYFAFDVEGQQIITSKGDKSKARCVAMGSSPKAVAVVAATTKAPETKVAEEKTMEKKDHNYYFAPFLGIGGLFTNQFAVSNSAYFNGELRAGYKMEKDLMLQGTVSVGLDAQGFTYPVITTIAVGPEYFIIPERLSVFLDLGLGIISTNTNFLTPGASTAIQNSAAFAWRLGGTLATIKWGDSGQYNLPITLVYTGYKTSMMICHTVLFGVGFMYFN